MFYNFSKFIAVYTQKFHTNQYGELESIFKYNKALSLVKIIIKFTT